MQSVGWLKAPRFNARNRSTKTPISSAGFNWELCAPYNKETAQQLKQLVADGDCPHLLFYGASGAGKKTLALAVLREIYGPGVEKVKVEGKTWKIKQGERNIEVRGGGGSGGARG